MIRPVHLILLAPLFLMHCGDDTGQLPAAVDASDGRVCVNCGDTVADAPDIIPEELCSVVWNKTLLTGGAVSHPAMGGKQNLIMVSSGQKLYALGEAGSVEWTWPDDDPDWEWPSGAVIPPPWELYSPALGREFAPVFGTNAGFVISVNKNGVSRFAIKVEGSVSGAPAITKIDDKYWILIVTDLGAIYVIKDESQYEVWSLADEQKLQYPREGSQPLVGPAALYGVESMLVLAFDRLLCFDLQSGDLRWEFVVDVDENKEATSNAIMDIDGNVYFVAGEDRTANEYARSYVFKVPPEGPDGGVESWLLTDSQTRVVSLSQGRQKTLLAGTNNAGIFSFDLQTKSQYWQFVGNGQNFEMVAQPIQNADGLVFFGAARFWLHVVEGNGDYHWHNELDIPDGDLGAILWPSSPILREDGLAIFHNGNRINAVRCSETGPAKLAWPRFGANNLNSGNIADPRLLEATPE
jgi:outer membrane protein assembly factor BamB